MSAQDEADRLAAEWLACPSELLCTHYRGGKHVPDCPAPYRRTVAAGLRVESDRARRALAVVTAEADTLEIERDAALARVTKLREIVKWAASTHNGDTWMRTNARRALVETEEPK